MAPFIAFLAVALLTGLSQGFLSPESTPAIDLLVSPLPQDDFFRSVYNRNIKIFRHDPGFTTFGRRLRGMWIPFYQNLLHNAMMMVF